MASVDSERFAVFTEEIKRFMPNEHCQETSDDDFESVFRSGTACLMLIMYATVQEIPTCEMRVFHDRTAASANDCTISLMLDSKGSEDTSDPILAVTNSLNIGGCARCTQPSQIFRPSNTKRRTNLLRMSAK